MGKKIELTGLRFGRWLVVSEDVDGAVSGAPVRWLCKCDCGTERSVSGNNLRGGSKSCGCLSRDTTATRNRKHGMSKTPEYECWQHMKARCYRETSQDYALYGGRGIRVCDQWVDDFDCFYRDMGPRPTPRHSIERLDVNGDYEPSNCVWALPEQQANNKRNNSIFTYGGEQITLAELSRRTGTPYCRLKMRLRTGMSVQDAVNKEDLRLVVKDKITIDGVSRSFYGWCKLLGINLSAAYARVHHGENPHDVISAKFVQRPAVVGLQGVGS